MGMYTELIFGATLKKNTPIEVINTLMYMTGQEEEKPINFQLPEGRYEFMLKSGSYYFAVNTGISKIWKDHIDNQYHISTRSNIKNYNNEIETFLSWIKPYIEQGSGNREFYAITIYEESSIPTIYYLREE